MTETTVSTSRRRNKWLLSPLVLRVQLSPEYRASPGRWLTEGWRSARRLLGTRIVVDIDLGERLASDRAANVWAHGGIDNLPVSRRRSKRSRL